MKPERWGGAVGVDVAAVVWRLGEVGVEDGLGAGAE
jgi:hypothetical protein